jgi:hypothetical protein
MCDVSSSMEELTGRRNRAALTLSAVVLSGIIS